MFADAKHRMMCGSGHVVRLAVKAERSVRGWGVVARVIRPTRLKVSAPASPGPMASISSSSSSVSHVEQLPVAGLCGVGSVSIVGDRAEYERRRDAEVVPTLQRQAARIAKPYAGGATGEIRRCLWWDKPKRGPAPHRFVVSTSPDEGHDTELADIAAEFVDGAAITNTVHLVDAGRSVADPTTSEQTAKKRFEQVVRGGAPKNELVGARRMDALRRMLSMMTPEQRRTISADPELMARTREFIGPQEYISFLAAAGTYTMMTRTDGSQVALHMSGAEADTFISAALDSIGHLAPYLESAAKAGRRGDGYVAVVNDEDWKIVYPLDFPDSAIGSALEQAIEAFTSTHHRDGVVIVKNNRGARSTVIHECMHRYAPDAILESFGENFNEGVTEYFTRLVTDRDGRPPSEGGRPGHRYSQGCRFVRDLLPLLGRTKVEQETALAEMNFNGKTGLLKQRFEMACIAQNLSQADFGDRWDQFKSATFFGLWKLAKAAIPLAPHLAITDVAAIAAR
jgi:hypothetical protein